MYIECVLNLHSLTFKCVKCNKMDLVVLWDQYKMKNKWYIWSLHSNIICIFINCVQAVEHMRLSCYRYKICSLLNYHCLGWGPSTHALKIEPHLPGYPRPLFPPYFSPPHLPPPDLLLLLLLCFLFDSSHLTERPMKAWLFMCFIHCSIPSA